MEGKIRFQEFSKRNYVFFIAALVILAWHTQIGLDGDSIWFSEQLEETSYMGFLTERYQDWTSRLLIEAGLLFFTSHVAVWRIVDVAVWVFLLYGLTKLTEEDYTAQLAGTVCLLCSCYSLKDMNGAGWIATINNYLWPLACFIGMLLILKKILQGQPIKWYAGAAGLILAVLTCNHEQGVAASFASIFCCILYMAWKKIKINKWVWGYLSVAIASLIFILSCPGNAVRKQTEISTYFQDFPELTLWNKLDMGITPICHYSIIDNNYLFLVFLSLLCIAVWKMPVASWKKYLAFAPIIGTLAVRYFLGEIEKFLPGVVNIVKPVGLKGTYVPGSGWSVLALFFYAGMVAFVLWELCLVWQVNHEDGIFLFAALGIGFGTVFMMCFSPTILISGTRTYLFWQAALVIASGHLWNKYLEKPDRQKMAVMVAGFAALSLIVHTDYIVWG